MDKVMIFVCLIVLAINVSIIVAFFGLCRNVAGIKDMLAVIQQHYLPTHSSANTPADAVAVDETRVMNFCRTLQKGATVTLADYGPCVYHGKWAGQYCFYPIAKDNLKSSMYLVRDVEPYLALPESALAKFVII